eukprot:1107941-Amphidinium_carterae.1
MLWRGRPLGRVELARCAGRNDHSPTSLSQLQFTTYPVFTSKKDSLRVISLQTSIFKEVTIFKCFVAEMATDIDLKQSLEVSSTIYLKENGKSCAVRRLFHLASEQELRREPNKHSGTHATRETCLHLSQQHNCDKHRNKSVLHWYL